MKSYFNLTFILFVSSLLAAVLPVHSQSYNKRFNRIQYPRVSTTIDREIEDFDIGQKNETVSYFDDLLRPVQIVNKAGSRNQRDMVKYIKYDEFGRQPLVYLPYSTYDKDGSYKENPVQRLLRFYENTAKVAHTTAPWHKTIFENSPLSRVLKQGSAGVLWQPKSNPEIDHSQKISYGFNEAGKIKRWLIRNGIPSTDSYWKTNKLRKNRLEDANNNGINKGMEETSYHDQKGKLVCKVQKNLEDGSLFETYYVYDDYDRLCFLITPKAVALLKNNQWQLNAEIESLMYSFEYDKKHRLIKKTTPGIDEYYYIYDRLNRLVLFQDGILRQENKWRFVKYDLYSRPVQEGLYVDNVRTNLESMQSYVDAQNIFYENYDSLNGYSNSAFPIIQASDDVLNIYYYDDYEFDVNGDYLFSNFSTKLESQPCYRMKGKLTGRESKVLNDITDDWVKEIYYYDDKYRLIRLITDKQFNQYDNIDYVDIEYDFSSNIIASYYHHSTLVNNKIEEHFIRKRFIYDHSNRLIEVKHLVDQQPEITQFVYKYNELGQIIEKNIHEIGASSFWQSADYKYNIQGWLTNINQSNLKNDNSIIEYDNQLEPDESVSGVKIDNLSISGSYYPGNLKEPETVALDYSIAMRLQVFNLNDTTQSREISLTESKTDYYSAKVVDSMKFRSLKDLDGQNMEIVYNGCSFDSYSSQAVFLDSIAEMARTQLLNSGLSDTIVEKELIDAIKSLGKSSVGVVYFNEDANDLFGMDILYNEGFEELNGAPQFDGKISGVKWQTSKFDIHRGYGFEYKNLNWLGNATYGVELKEVWSGNRDRYSVQDIQYDKNGNILTLKRNGQTRPGTSPVYGCVDDLDYSYYGNQLQSVDDAIASNETPNDFKDNGSFLESEYSYDANGRLTSDLNKGISEVSYNYLNLPERVSFGQDNEIHYLYDARGRKLLKETLYVENEQQMTTETAYINGCIYTDTSLHSIQFEGGRLVPNQEGKLNYQYYLTDYLGNTRVVFGDDNDDKIIETVQVNSYYPFGMNIGDLSYIAGLENNYLLQGNEIQKDAFDLNGDGQIDRTFLWHDFNARFYDAQLARWHVPDPILNDFSPYSVNHNNPLLFTDKSGLTPTWVIDLPEVEVKAYANRSGAEPAPLREPTFIYTGGSCTAPYFWSSGNVGGSSGSLINRGGGHSGSMGGYWNTVEHPSSASSTGESSYTPPPPPTMAEQEAYGKKQLVELGGKIKDAANSGGGTQSLIPNSDVYLSITGFSWLWGAAAALNEPHFRVDPASIAAGKFIGKIIIGLNVAATAAEGYDLVSNWDQAGQGDVAKFGVDATLTTVTTILYFTGVGAPVAVLLTGIQVANTLGTFDPIYESFNEPIHGGSGSW